MPKKRPTFREDLCETSDQWCAKNGIPAGYYVTLLRRPDNRQVRTDFKIHRRTLPVRASDNMTLKASLDDLAGVFLTDLSQRRYELKLRGPDRANVDGKFQMKSVRDFTVTDNNAEAASYEKADNVETSSDRIESAIVGYERYIEDVFANLEHGECLPPDAIARGTLQALVANVGMDAVRRAAEVEGII